MNIPNRVNAWINGQHGTAGWQEKLIKLVEDIVDDGINMIEDYEKKYLTKMKDNK